MGAVDKLRCACGRTPSGMSASPPKAQATPKRAKEVEDECELAACQDTMSVLSKAFQLAGAEPKGKGVKKAAKKKGPAVGGDSPESATSAPYQEVPPKGVDLAEWRRRNCPLTRGSLGDATWGLLHSTAAYYPEEPSPEQQDAARGLVKGVAELYPCTHCREDFKHAVAEDPPKVDSRTHFSLWLCRQHNLVNEKIGQPLFPCEMSILDRRWRTGSPACWQDPKYEEDRLAVDSAGDTNGGGSGGNGAAP